MPTIKTKWFANTMAGAPALSGSVGAMIAVLDACLKDGFNLLTLDSLVISGNVATATKTGHAYVVNQVLLIAGITGGAAALNGDVRVTEVTANTFKFATSGISDQTATGTITAKAAPAGWEKQFSGTNLAVYRSGNGVSSRAPLKVDDTVGQYSTVTMAEGYTDISTAVNSVVTQYFKKSSTTDATARAWLIVGDDKGFYLGVAWNGGGIYDFYHFGDFKSYLAGDGYNCRLQALSNSAPGTFGQYGGSVSDAAINGTGSLPGYVARPYSMLVSAANPVYQCSMAGAIGLGVSSTNLWAVSGQHGFGGNLNSDPYSNPSPIDNGLHFCPVYIQESVAGGKALRGGVRGLLHVIETLPIASGYSIYSGVENVASGLVLLARGVGNYTQSVIYPESVVGFNLGDWE